MEEEFAMKLHTATLFVGFMLAACVARGQQSYTVTVDSAKPLGHASVYDVPEYPAASAAAGHAGRVTVEVSVATNRPASPLARAQTTRVIEAPDTLLARAVLKMLDAARWMPFFNDSGHVERAAGTVSWDFRLAGGKAEVTSVEVFRQHKSLSETSITLVAMLAVDSSLGESHDPTLPLSCSQRSPARVCATDPQLAD
jgi:hypothetical protein